MAERTFLAKPRSISVLENNPAGRSSPQASPPASVVSPSTAQTPVSAAEDLPTSRPLAIGTSASILQPDLPSSIAPQLPTTPKVVTPPSARAVASLVSNTTSSQRVTRASTRQIANQLSNTAAAATEPASGPRPTPLVQPSPQSSRQSFRKRKAEAGAGPRDPQHLSSQASTRHTTKRRKNIRLKSPISASENVPPPARSTRSRKGRLVTAMSSSRSTSERSDALGGRGPSSSRSKRNTTDVQMADSLRLEPSNNTAQHVGDAEDPDTAMTGADDSGIDRAPAPQQQAEADPDGHSEDDDVDGDDDDDEDDGDDDLRRFTEGGFGDPFGSGFPSSNRGPGLPAALSILGGMLSMSGMGGRLREILSNLRRKEDPSVQLIALQDLSEILLVSNEDNLIGSFSPDPYVRELVSLMQPNEITGEENPEIMLLACRCLANMMEAIPASAANVVYGGAVPVLCQKLLEISFIDLAEQALSTLEKISVEYPSRIVREGGLTACLSYLEFFATSTQRTAVTTAANCCRNIPEDSFSVVRGVMPILLNVLNSNDQRVVEQAALCVSRIVESFQHYPSKLEELVGVDLLKTILRLLLPGSTNHLIGPNLHTQFLRVLAITADDSPRLAAELFKMNIVETLYQNLTGVSPPAGTDNIAAKLDTVLIMQALIHRPREQIIETLNVICNLLPAEIDTAPADLAGGISPVPSEGWIGTGHGRSEFSQRKSEMDEKRLVFLNGCKEEVRRFTLILLPTLTDAYSSTVNLDVRLRVLTAQKKMLSNFDRDIVLEALRAVPYASFLASILSQQDHPSLVSSALQATELLMSRLGDIYRYQLYREGVITEIEKIAAAAENGEQAMSSTRTDENSRDMDLEPSSSCGHSTDHPSPIGITDQGLHQNFEHSSDHDYDALSGGRHNPGYDEDIDDDSGSDGDGSSDVDDHIEADLDLDIDKAHEDVEENDSRDSMSQQSSNEDNSDIDKIDEDAEEGNGIRNERETGNNADDHVDEMPGSPASSGDSTTSRESPPRRRVVKNAPSRAQMGVLAKRFLNKHETEKNDNAIRTKATQTLSSLSSLANEISAFYMGHQTNNASLEDGIDLFRRLAVFFDSNVFESATSAELLGSGVVRVLEQVFSNPDEHFATAARSAFLESFMGQPVKSQMETLTTEMPTTPFSILVHKLQDLLSRSEHFEVVTVHHNTFDGNHTSAASMLAKQIRLRLVADDDSDVPLAFKSIMVSIHAIATFKTLEDYLRPRITISDRSRNMRRDELSRALAAMAGSSANALATATAARLATRGSQLFSGTSLLPDNRNENMGSGLPRHRQAQTSPRTPPATHPRTHRKSDKAKSIAGPAGVDMAMPTATASDTEEKAGPRRSSRHRTTSSSKKKTARSQDGHDGLTDALECDGEKHAVSTKSNLELPNTGAMDTVVGELEDMTSDDALDASAVNLEVMTGGEIAARSRSSSKAPANISALTAALRGASPTPPASNIAHPSAHGSAIHPLSQDWHIEFTLDGKVVPLDNTVYRAVLNSINGRNEQLGRSVWSTVHTVHYRRVRGSEPSEPLEVGVTDGTQGNPATSLSSPIGLGSLDGIDNSPSPGVYAKAPITSSILRLLKNLHDLNANIDDIFVANKETLKPNAEPLLQFVNTKLTAKLNRQLEEPLIVASNCLPGWSEDLARLYPFLFPFETRHLFLQSTSFGYARSMARWQNAQVQDESRRDRRDDRPFLGRLQRQKVRISRSKILESAVKVMELYGASQSILEVEYFEEVGTGLGPTLEFYSTVSREFSKKKLRLWRDNDLSDSEFVSGPNGLFPRPLSDEDATGTNGERMISLFKALGKFVARSMLDSRIIDINFNPIFFRIGDGSSAIRPSLGAVKTVDPALARSLLLIKRFATARDAIEEDRGLNAAEKAAAISAIAVNNTHIEDLSLDFTLPGYPEIELIPSGCQTSVTIDNVGTYVDKVVSMTLEGGVRRQVEAFQKGFSQVFPYSALSAFTPDELVSLFGRVEEDWSLETLMDSIKADHGFNMDSRSVRNLLQVMSEMTPTERRDFLQFTTGSPRLPIGGFRSLTPMFTVVCKPSEAPYTSDDYLPSVMTCVNYLKLPDYTTIDTLRKRLLTAVKEGQGAFHLS